MRQRLFGLWMVLLYTEGHEGTQRDGGPTRRDRSYIAVARFLDMPRQIAQERIYRVQCRVARCDMGLPAHTCHPIWRLFAGPIP